jgi:hypothetical protein
VARLKHFRPGCPDPFKTRARVRHRFIRVKFVNGPAHQLLARVSGHLAIGAVDVGDVSVPVQRPYSVTDRFQYLAGPRRRIVQADRRPNRGVQRGGSALPEDESTGRNLVKIRR